jgi:hypothetical protein
MLGEIVLVGFGEGLALDVGVEAVVRELGNDGFAPSPASSI